MDYIRALIFIRLKQEQMPAFLTLIQGLPQVRQYYALTGEFDGLLEVETRSIEELYTLNLQYFQGFSGLQHTNTHIVVMRI
ncbi:MAG: hypothetical protein RBG13Loki_1038 [Promethearchaeota archaeon CR_4]|nr:MAG: hypothetical protein RBG13Loki_1038 [Candidatus Lokiarchaeota archaeon CR_4]